MKQTKFFPALTGLRALAVYLVYVHHHSDLISASNGLPRKVLDQGYIGVSIFFVLSGFLIHYCNSHLSSWDKSNLLGYFRRRWARTYPLYLLIVIVLDLSKPTSVTQWFFDLTLLKGFSDKLKFSGLPQSWSLTVEESFYFCFPALTVFTKNRSARLLGSLLGIYCIGSFFTLGATYSQSQLFFSTFQFTFFYTFFGRAGEFFLGIAASIAYQNAQKQTSSLRPQRSTYSGLIGMASVVFFFVLLVAHADSPALAIYTPTGLLLHNLLLPFFVSQFIFGLLTENTLPRHLLSLSAVQYAGRTSYAFYLLPDKLISQWLEAGGIHTKFVTMFFIHSVMAAILYHFIEVPLHRFLAKSKLRKRA